MESPPPNYNPNESMLNGGTDVPIMKIMGGGGGDNNLNGYNETQSLLNGGLDAVIEKIEGGADPSSADPSAASVSGLDSLEIVDNYREVENKATDRKDYEKLVKLIQKSKSITTIISRLKNAINTKSKYIFHYVNKGNNLLERTNLPIADNQIIIRYIPSSARYIVVVPILTDPYDFFLFVKFLIIGDLCTIDQNNSYILRTGVYIVFFGLSNDNKSEYEILEYLYLKFRGTNIHQTYLITNYDDIEKKQGIINEKVMYSSIINGNKTIGFNNGDFFKPNDNSLDITNLELVQEYGIKALKYNTSDATYEDIEIIKSGDSDPTSKPSNFNFSLKNKLAIIRLKELDITYQTINIYGKTYKIRVPRFTDLRDPIYKQWTDGNYKGDEIFLIEKLNLNDLLGEKLPKFLFYLSYFKCFDDVSLLTRHECEEMRIYLNDIYIKLYEYKNEKEE